MPKNTDISLNFINLVEEPICYLSSDFVILDLNASAEKIFKIKKNSIIGELFSVLCPDLDLKASEHPFEGNLMTHIGKKTLSWHSLFLKKPKNGIKFIVIGTVKNKKNNSSFNINIKKERDESTYEEIASLLLAEQLNDKSKNTLEYVKNIYRYMENIIAQIPVSVYWMNKDCVYLGCSNSMAKLLNLKSRHDMVGKTYADLFDEKSTSHYKKVDRTVMDEGIPLNLEEPLYYPDGTKKIYLSNKVPLHDLDGKIIGMLGISVDITDRKKMEEELKKAKEAAETANRAKTEFLANMSHDIRTPLTGVIGLSGILENTLQNPEQKEDAHLLHDSGEELLSLLNDILDDVRADHMLENDINEEVFYLHQCIQDLIRLELPTTKLKHLGLQVDIEANVPPYIISDRKKIYRILLNLLGNAIKFTQSGHITIKVKCLDIKASSVHLQFSVADTGIGIPKKLQAQVFDRFFRVTPSYKGLYPGHGLGLHIANSYVSLLGGHITLTSEEGVGSTFNFDLECKVGQGQETVKKPTITPEGKPFVPLHESHASPNSVSVPHLLLVEDNAIALKVLESLISSGGYRFTSASDGEQALKLAKSMTFDLVITDIGLPGISGNELTRLIRDWEKALNKTPLPIFGLTGHARESAKPECMACGMNDVFTKPINLAMVQEIINKFGVSIVSDQSQVPSKDNTDQSGKLGVGLPDTEDELFQLDAYPVFDIKFALQQVNDLSLFFQIIKDSISDNAQEDTRKMEQAYAQKDWSQIEKIAHKLKGGAVYIGTRRFQYACQYFEQYYKAGHRSLLDKLYDQLININRETNEALEKWLKKYATI